jgi:hypothetical protein
MAAVTYGAKRLLFFHDNLRETKSASKWVRSGQ